MKKIKLQKKVVEGKTFYYIDIGKEEHYRPSFRLWINRQLVQTDEGGEYISFPIQNARVIRTEKGNYVLRPEENWNTFKVGVLCGYRGTSTFKVLEPAEAEIFSYKEYASQLGSLGISEYALVSVKSDKVKIRWERTGRLYGDAPEGITIYYSDGKIEEIEGLQDGLEALQELEKELRE